jgi:hypothetical protein
MARPCGTAGEHSRRIARRDWRDGRDGCGLIWFIWSVLFTWLVSFNQTNQTDHINKGDQPVLALDAPMSLALPAFFIILLRKGEGIVGFLERAWN